MSPCAITNNEQSTLDFLTNVFYKLSQNEQIEIRPFCEQSPDNQYRAFLNSPEDVLEHIREIPSTRDVYFGLGTRKRGKSGKKEDIEHFACLAFDFDFKDHKNLNIAEIKHRFVNINLEPAYIVSSGNGYHAYILIDKTIASEIEPFLLHIGVLVGADVLALKLTQILRVPDTYNNKDANNPKRVEIVYSNTSKRYSIKDLQQFFKIPKTIPEKIKKNNVMEIFESSRPCINKIARGVKAGERNFALGRLTKYYQSQGHTKEQTLKKLIEWNERNEPPESLTKLKRDFETYWHSDYKLLGCEINKPELQGILSKYCDRNACRMRSNFNSIGKIKLDNTTAINNRIFNYYASLSGNDLIVYAILLKHKNGLSVEHLRDKLHSNAMNQYCMSKPTMLSAIKKLSAKGFVKIVKSNNRAGESNFIKAILQGTYGMGYTLVSYGAVRGAISGDISKAEFRVYVLLLRYAMSNETAYPSLLTLAKELRQKDHGRISKQIHALENADYLKINYTYTDKRVKKLVYELLV